MFALERIREEAADYLDHPGLLTENLRAYVNLVHRYGSGQQGEFWLQIVKGLEAGEQPSPWVHELAVSWYLNRNCPNEAKIWLARAHELRVKTPLWQKILLALAENDKALLTEILNEQAEGISSDELLAILEKLGQRQKALQLAETRISPERKVSGQAAAPTRLAAAFKQEFPGYWRSGYAVTDSDLLETAKTQGVGRYSFANLPIGLGLFYQHNRFASSVYNLDGHDQSNDLSTNLFVGNGELGAAITLGLNSQELDDTGYGRLQYWQRLTENLFGRLDLDIGTIPVADSILQPAALHHRVAATLTGTFALNYYYSLHFFGRDYFTRESNDIAKGYGSVAEIGFQQEWGKFTWQLGIQGNYEHHYSRSLPDDLKLLLPATYAIDDIVADEATSLLIGGRFGRGAIREEYPSATSLRYFVSFWGGNSWPLDNPVFHLQAGFGTRLFGNDELSFKLHYNQSGETVGYNDDSGFSIQYQYNY